MLLQPVPFENKEHPETCMTCSGELSLDHQGDLACTKCTTFYHIQERRWYTL